MPYKSKSAERDYQTKRRLHWRAAALAVLGGKCARCGNADERVLQIDHVNGGGRRDPNWTHNTRTYAKRVVASVLAGEATYQLLCSNCNWIKRWENGEHRSD